MVMKCPVCGQARARVPGAQAAVGACGVHARVEGARVRLSSREEGLCLDLPGWEGRRGNSLRLWVTTWGGRGARPGHAGGAAAAGPRPHQLPVLRLDGPLPSGVRADGDTLGFPPLTAEHSGIYVCRVSNDLAWRESQVTVEVLGELGEPGGRAAGAAPWGPRAERARSGCLSPADPEAASGKQVDLVSASVVVVGVIAGLLLCLLVVVVVLMSRYHRRKAQQMSQK